MNDNRYGEQFRGIPGFVAVSGSDGFEHYFGGYSFPVIKGPAKWGKSIQLLTLDLTDPRLSAIKFQGLDELPLVCYLNVTCMPDRQDFQISPRDRRVTVLHVSSTRGELFPEEDRLPNPLPRTALRLRAMTPDEHPLDEESFYAASDTFVGGDAFIRVLGPPIWLYDVEIVKCRKCRQKMTYVASIGYERYDRPSGFISDNRPYFPGEFATYFFLCPLCLVTTVTIQTT